MTSLAAVVAERHDAVEADLLRYYGVDLLDLYRGRLSLRRLRVLLKALPRESSLARSISEEEASWGVTDYLLASVIDAVQNVGWVVAASNSKRQPKRPPPFPRPRQRQTQEKPKMSQPHEVASFFAAIGGR